MAKNNAVMITDSNFRTQILITGQIILHENCRQFIKYSVRLRTLNYVSEIFGRTAHIDSYGKLIYGFSHFSLKDPARNIIMFKNLFKFH